MTLPSAAQTPTARGADAARLLLIVCIGLALYTGIVVARTHPLGTGFDEIAHLSFVVAVRDHPTLFPAWGTYVLLDPLGGGWTSTPNWIAHPPLYYLIASPLTALFPGDVLPLRLFDVALDLSGLALMALAGLNRLRGTLARVVFVAAVFGPPMTLGVSGLVNNDALMRFEIGLLVYAAFAEQRRPVLIALMLAALGWTKIHGFVAGSLFVAMLHLGDLRSARARLASPATALLVLGVGVGLVPHVANFVALGRPVWVPPAFPDWFRQVPPDVRATVSILDYARVWFRDLALLLPYHASIFEARPLLLALFVLPFTALRRAAAPDPATRDLALACLAAVAATTALLFAYGWSSFRATGSLEEIQTRYFLPIWPMLAFTLALGVAALPRLVAPLVAAALLIGLAAASPPGYALLAELGWI